MEIRVKVNGEQRTAEVPPQTTLLVLLRDSFGLTGTKLGCDVGDCGACTVVLNGRTVNSCLVLAASAEGADVVTIEGLADAEHLHPLQQTMERLAALQCGFCGPGMILSARALLEVNPAPSAAAVREALAGNLCRCTGYTKIVEAVVEAGRGMAEGENG